jgi:hypothetical protein
MTIEFETEIKKARFRAATLTIYSTHTTKDGVLCNMFSGAGHPMLSVSEALVLREHLDSFINSQVT